MEDHRSLGEFSIDKKNTSQALEEKYIIESDNKNQDMSYHGNQSVGNLFNTPRSASLEVARHEEQAKMMLRDIMQASSSNVQDDVETEKNIKIEKKQNSSKNGLPKIDKRNLISSSKVLYKFSDLISLGLSYLLFFLASSYVDKLQVEDVYKKNGVIALFFIALSINSYYLFRPYIKKRKNVLDKISFVSISCILFSALCVIFQLIAGDYSARIFEYCFFIGSIIFVADNICFSAGLEKIKEFLSLKKDYSFKDSVNVASTSNLSSATVQKKSLKDLKRNDLVHVKIGDTICFDGEVVDGEAVVLKRLYAGEAEAGVLSKKIYAFAGTKIINGELIIRVDNLLEDTFIYDNISVCQSAINGKQKIFSKKVIAYFGSVLVLLYGLYFIIMPATNKDLSFLTISASLLISCGLASSILRVFLLKDIFASIILKKAFSKNIVIPKKETLSRFSEIEKFIFDFNNNAFTNDWTVEKFRLYDDRIDEKYFLEALFSVFSKSDSLILKSINSYIAKKQNIIKVYKLENYAEYGECNLLSSLASTRFVVGEEQFMIDMKVKAQESDFISENENSKVIYVAINDIVVGNFVLGRNFYREMQNLLSTVSKQKNELYLLSAESETSIDEVAKNIGFNPVNVFAGLSPKDYLEKISMLNDSVFFSNLNTDKNISLIVDNNVGVFDPVLCETENFDVVLYNNNISSYTNLMSYIAEYKAFNKKFIVSVIILSLILGGMFFNPLYVILSTFIAQNIILNLFRLDYLRERK